MRVTLVCSTLVENAALKATQPSMPQESLVTVQKITGHTTTFQRDGTRETIRITQVRGVEISGMTCKLLELLPRVLDLKSVLGDHLTDDTAAAAARTIRCDDALRRDL